MRTFFIQLRVYRAKDQHYVTLLLKTQASKLADLESIVSALEAGLKVAGAVATSLEQVYFDYPAGTAPANEYVDLGEHDILSEVKLEEIRLFLGQKRDRRKKVEPAITTESEDQP
jgi:hypothetical protein